MAKLVNKSIFETGLNAIVNPVNCIGVMGKGLALEFKNRYPKNYDFYLKNDKQMKPGSILVYQDEVLIINAATKNHWIDKSNIGWIKTCAQNIGKYAQEHGIDSIAVPMLGCGLGGLNEEDVLIVLQTYLPEESLICRQ